MEVPNGTTLLAQGGLDHLRDLRNFLARRGVEAQIIQPPGYTGKG